MKDNCLLLMHFISINKFLFYMKKIYKVDGLCVSVVTDLPSCMQAETVYHGKKQAEQLVIYADDFKSSGDMRQRVHIRFATDGRTIVGVDIYSPIPEHVTVKKHALL